MAVAEARMVQNAATRIYEACSGADGGMASDSGKAYGKSQAKRCLLRLHGKNATSPPIRRGLFSWFSSNGNTKH